MSFGRRAYDVLRGYVNREWDRVQSVDKSRAELELEEAMRNPEPQKASAASSDSSSSPQLPMDEKTHACRVLGVAPDAQFEEIRKAFERLNKRADPANFPANSDEAGMAADLRVRVNWAYTKLTEDMDQTERRFKSLEI